MHRNTIAPVAAFLITAAVAVRQQWSLQEFCWSVWLSGLVYSWACIGTGGIILLLRSDTERSEVLANIPALQSIPRPIYAVLRALAISAIAIVLFYAYSYLFGFYGLFLSFFAEMRPHDLFGRNGFINSDFYTPVTFLLQNYWPMALGVVVANIQALRHTNPWAHLFSPFSTELVVIHIFVVLQPFLTLAVWAVFQDAYQPVGVVVLMGLFYLLPQRLQRRENTTEASAS